MLEHQIHSPEVTVLTLAVPLYTHNKPLIRLHIIIRFLYTELAPGTIRFTGDRAQGDDSKHDSHYKYKTVLIPKLEIISI